VLKEPQVSKGPKDLKELKVRKVLQVVKELRVL
jgi:hypothetical protein